VDGCIHSGTVSRETLSAIGVTVVVVPGGFRGVLNGEKKGKERVMEGLIKLGPSNWDLGYWHLFQ
jgi:hypothetical protein